MIDQNSIVIDDFRGLYRWYDEDAVPPNHFKDCLNLEFYPKGFNSRSGLALTYQPGAEGWNGTVLRTARYEIPDQSERLILLDNTGQFWDMSVPVSILTVAGATDFSLVSMFGRAYISPHDGLQGLQDTGLYVYDPNVSSSARLAAGDPPSDFELSLASTIPSVVLTDVVAPVAPFNGAFTLTTSPFIPVPPSTLKFTQAGGAVTAFTITIVGEDESGEAQTVAYVNKVLSAGPTTFTTLEIWSKITSATGSGLTGAGGTIKIEITGKPGAKIERGTRIVAIAYETASGFITRPGPATADGTNFATLNVTKAKRVITVSGIPATPPAGTTKIHILAAKAVVTKRYTGNPNEYELFFIPDSAGGIIPVGQTSAIINFFDADLVDSADFLKDNLSQIPAGVALLATSRGRLIVSGMNSTSVVGGNDDLANNTVIFASTGGEPEAFSGTDGFVIVKPGGDGIRNLTEYRSLIYVYKDTRTFVTQDNGALPSEWEIESIDESLGAGSHSIALALGSDSSSEDVLIIGSRAGLYPFNGSYSDRPLTWKIREIWDNIIKENLFEQIQVAVDTINKFIFIAIPFTTDDYSDGFVLHGNYSDGLTWDNIKWCPWTFYRTGPATLTPTSIFATLNNAIPVLRVGSLDGNIYTYQYKSALTQDNAIDREAFWETSKFGYSETGGVSQISGIRHRITGPCTLLNTILGPNGTVVETLANETVAAVQDSNILIKLNFVEDDASYKGRITSGSFQVSRSWIFGTEAWLERPA